MSRSTITPQARAHLTMDVTPGSATVTWTNGDPTNGHSFSITGRELLLARNAGSSSAWVKVIGASDAFGRTGTTGNYAVAAGATAVFAVSPLNVWGQTGNVAWVDVESSDIKLAVIRYP